MATKSRVSTQSYTVINSGAVNHNNAGSSIGRSSILGRRQSSNNLPRAMASVEVLGPSTSARGLPGLHGIQTNRKRESRTDTRNEAPILRPSQQNPTPPSSRSTFLGGLGSRGSSRASSAGSSRASSAGSGHPNQGRRTRDNTSNSSGTLSPTSARLSQLRSLLPSRLSRTPPPAGARRTVESTDTQVTDNGIAPTSTPLQQSHAPPQTHTTDTHNININNTVNSQNSTSNSQRLLPTINNRSSTAAADDSPRNSVNLHSNNNNNNAHECRKSMTNNMDVDISTKTSSACYTIDRWGKGTVGLSNLGNTCFMNACLQCLSNTPWLVDYFLSNKFRTDLCKKSPTEGALATAFAELLANLHASGTPASVSPSQIKRLVTRYAPHFSGYHQHDCQEFMRFLLDGLGEDLHRSRYTKVLALSDESLAQLSLEDQSLHMWKMHQYRNDSIITDLLCGQLHSTVKCTSCGHVSHCFDPFLDLSVPIPGAKYAKTDDRECTLDNCLKTFTAEEVLEGQNAYKCERCKERRRCTKTLRVMRCPALLVIHLKRFEYSEENSRKLSACVSFPNTKLDLTPFTSQGFTSPSGVRPIYDLFGVANHYGGLGGGHYTASCQNVVDKQWYSFDDDRVDRIGSSLACGPEGYVLLYRLQGL